MHIGPESFPFLDTSTKSLYVARAEIPGLKFLGEYGTCLCWWIPDQLCLVMISEAGRLLSYEEGRQYV
jgi:hypothetical protein